MQVKSKEGPVLTDTQKLERKNRGKKAYAEAIKLAEINRKKNIKHKNNRKRVIKKAEDKHRKMIENQRREFVTFKSTVAAGMKTMEMGFPAGMPHKDSPSLIKKIPLSYYIERLAKKETVWFKMNLKTIIEIDLKEPFKLFKYSVERKQEEHPVFKLKKFLNEREFTMVEILLGLRTTLVPELYKYLKYNANFLEKILYFNKPEKYVETKVNFGKAINKPRKNNKVISTMSKVDKRKPKNPENTLVCIARGTVVYRVTRKLAKDITETNPEFMYVDKSVWKKARLKGNVSFTIPKQK